MSNNIKVNIYKEIAFSFAIISFILVFVILYFTFSKAVITIIPKEVNVSSTFVIDVGLNDREGDIKGRIIETNIFTKKDFESSYTEIEGEGTATGKVTLFNQTGSAMTLVPTTRLLSTEGILFRLKNKETIPAKGKRENVEVYADKEGVSGDIDPTTFSIPGLGANYEEIVYAESTTRMSGGSNKVHKVTEEDINIALEEIKKELRIEALEKLKLELEVGDSLLQEATKVSVLDTEISAKVGDSNPIFEIYMSIEVQGIVADRDEILKLAKEKLYISITPEKELLSVNNEEIEYQLEKYDKIDSLAQLKVTIVGNTMLHKTSEVLDKNNLMGKTKEEVKTYLLAEDGIENVQVELSPFLLRTVPKISDHIEIILK